MLTDHAGYHDLGRDYFSKHDPERVIRRITGQANFLGLTVRFDPIPDAGHIGVTRSISGQSPSTRGRLVPTVHPPSTTISAPEQ